MTSEFQLVGVLEAAATRLRSGLGWDERTTGEVLCEILHVYSAQVKKALRDGSAVGGILTAPSRTKKSLPTIRNECHSSPKNPTSPVGFGLSTSPNRYALMRSAKVGGMFTTSITSL